LKCFLQSRHARTLWRLSLVLRWLIVSDRLKDQPSDPRGSSGVAVRLNDRIVLATEGKAVYSDATGPRPIQINLFAGATINHEPIPVFGLQTRSGGRRTTADHLLRHGRRSYTAAMTRVAKLVYFRLRGWQPSKDKSHKQHSVHARFGRLSARQHTESRQPPVPASG
jgi:hypothetical protein